MDLPPKGDASLVSSLGDRSIILLPRNLKGDIFRNVSVDEESFFGERD